MAVLVDFVVFSAFEDEDVDGATGDDDDNGTSASAVASFVGAELVVGTTHRNTNVERNPRSDDVRCIEFLWCTLSLPARGRKWEKTIKNVK